MWIYDINSALKSVIPEKIIEIERMHSAEHGRIIVR